TTDGVVRAPSAFSMTLGFLPSMTATHELVVPRSMPMILAMGLSFSLLAAGDAAALDQAPRVTAPYWAGRYASPDKARFGGGKGSTTSPRAKRGYRRIGSDMGKTAGAARVSSASGSIRRLIADRGRFRPLESAR